MEKKNKTSQQDKGGIGKLQKNSKKKARERTKKLKEARAALKESETVLKIRVKAKTRELRELADTLEDKIKERTKGLENSRKALMNMLEDVEEEKRIAEGERNKTLSIIVNFADGLLVFDKNRKLSLINPKAIDFFRIEKKKVKEIIGKSIAELSDVSPFKSLAKLIGEEVKKVFRKRLQIRENLILEISAVPIIKEKANKGCLVILHDITREKMIEKTKSEFVSISAHQLRTPLSAMKWALRMLLDGDLGDVVKEQKEFLEDAYASNEKMIALINDLLNVTSIEEGKYLYEPALTNIENLIDSIINSRKEKAKKRNIELEFRKPRKKMSKVILDAGKMNIAIANLVDNAIRYTPCSGKVIVSLRQDKKEINFSIKDTGVGIPKAQQDRVFTKFFRGANVIRMETEGTGLGLFITKNIIEAHHGKIWFESKKNIGTTFYVTLPVKVKEKFTEFLEEF